MSAQAAADIIRYRQYSWADPRRIAEAAPTTTGLEFLRRIVSGELPQPPIASTLGFALVAAEEGTVTLKADTEEYGYNALGTMHGGVIATWADTALGYAVQSRIPAGTSITTLDIQVRYLRAIGVGTGTVTIVGTAQHVGRTTGVATAELRDDAGRLLATASTTCLVIAAS